LLACETLLPTMGPFPVTWHTRAIAAPFRYSEFESGRFCVLVRLSLQF